MIINDLSHQVTVARYGSSAFAVLFPGDVALGTHAHQNCVLGLQMPLSMSCIGLYSLL